MNKLTKTVTSVVLGVSLLFTTVPEASAATYTVKKGDTLETIAKKYGTTYKALMTLNGLKSSNIKVGQKLKVNSKTTSTAKKKSTTKSSSATKTNVITYTVKKGDSLETIAKKYGTTYKKLMTLNGLKSTNIKVGQKLKVNSTTNTKKSNTTISKASTTIKTNIVTYTVKKGDTLDSIAKKYGTTYKNLMTLNGLKSTTIKVGQKLKVSGSTTTTKTNTTTSKSTSSTSTSEITYTVVKGDTLDSIAKKYGTTYQAIMSLNGLKTTTIKVGQKLKISGKSTSTTTTNPTTNASNNANVISAKAISIAMEYLGTPYLFGGITPSGFDCSGLVYYAYLNAGKTIIRTTAEGYYNIVQKVNTPQVGDLVFFSNTYKDGISHIGIYIGNNEMISATESGVKIDSIYSSYWQEHFTGFGRFY